MIIVKLRGGLGNQMFQYAFGKAIAISLNEKLYLDLTWYRKSDREFLLDRFLVSFDGSSRNRLFMKLLYLMKKPVTLKDTPDFKKEDLRIHKNVILNGYWESYGYFEKTQDIIRREFVLKKPSNRLIELAKSVNKDSIAVHIRRGDYLVPHGKYLNGYEYCNKGVEYIMKNKGLKNPLITVFSDDAAWCREHMKTLGGCPTEIFNEKMASDAEELMLMSLYGNNVISNSTFSWWAAFLNKNDDRIVVMPRNWFTDEGKNERCVSRLKIPGWTIL